MVLMHHDDFLLFCQHVRNPLQAVTDDHCKRFLAALSATLDERAVEIQSEAIWWRAQRGCSEAGTSNQRPYSPGRMLPDAARVGEGRANAARVAHLYMASDRETAMAEVRPVVGDAVSCGRFVVMKNLRIVDCRVYAKPLFFFDPSQTADPLQPPTQEALNSLIWSQIDAAFSEPVGSDPHPLVYLPTQVLAAFFKSKGFDGLGYKSRLGPGFNLVLFDVSAAQITDCRVFELKEVMHHFEEVAPMCETSEETSARILNLLRLGPTLTARQLATQLELSLRSIELQLAKLKAGNRLQRVGPNKGGKWVVL